MTVEAYTPKCNYINTAFNTANVNLDLSNAKVLEIFGNAGQLLADPENVVYREWIDLHGPAVLGSLVSWL